MKSSPELTSGDGETVAPDESKESTRPPDGPPDDSGQVTSVPSTSQEKTRRWSTSKTLLVLFLVTVLLVGAAVASVIVWSGRHETEAARGEALSAARKTAVDLVTLNASSADQDLRRVLDDSTGSFADLYQKNLNDYTTAVQQSQVQSSGKITSAGVETFDGEVAKVLVAMKTSVKNSQLPEGQPRVYGISLTMNRVPDGRWLTSDVEFLS